MRTATRQSRVRRLAAAGYNLVAVTIGVAVMSVLLATALPSISGVIQRDKEEELIFRGMQYAEAIRVFQGRYGRYPNTLNELLEVKPRCIRQLFADPIAENGKWRLLVAGQGQAARALRQGAGPGQQGQNLLGDNPFAEAERKARAQENPFGSDLGGGSDWDEADDSWGDDDDDWEDDPFGSPRDRDGDGDDFLGPIQGVHTGSKDEAMSVFFDQTRLSEWVFSPKVVEIQKGIDGFATPRLWSTRPGKPFPQWVLDAQWGNADDDLFGENSGGRDDDSIWNDG